MWSRCYYLIHHTSFSVHIFIVYSLIKNGYFFSFSSRIFGIISGDTVVYLKLVTTIGIINFPTPGGLLPITPARTINPNPCKKNRCSCHALLHTMSSFHLKNVCRNLDHTKNFILECYEMEVKCLTPFLEKF